MTINTQLYALQHDGGKTLLIAPLHVLRMLLKLQDPALRRIVDETDGGGTCTLHAGVGRVYFDKYSKLEVFRVDMGDDIDWI